MTPKPVTGSPNGSFGIRFCWAFNRSLARQLSHEAQSKSHGDKEKNRQARRNCVRNRYILCRPDLGALCSRMGLFALATPSPEAEEKELHPYYRQFTRNRGMPVKCIDSYSELDKFLAEGMQWGERRRTPRTSPGKRILFSMSHLTKACRFGYSPMRAVTLPILLRPAGSPEDALSLLTVPRMPRPTHLLRKPTASRFPSLTRLRTCGRKTGTSSPAVFYQVITGRCKCR